MRSTYGEAAELVGGLAARAANSGCEYLSKQLAMMAATLSNIDTIEPESSAMSMLVHDYRLSDETRMEIAKGRRMQNV